MDSEEKSYIRNGIGFENGSPVLVTEDNHCEQEKLADAEAAAAVAVIMKRVFEPLLFGNGGKTARRAKLETVGLRTICAAAHFGVEGVAGVPLAELARELDLTRAALSRIALELSEEFQLVAGFQRSKKTREANREAALRTHAAKEKPVQGGNLEPAVNNQDSQPKEPSGKDSTHQ